MLVTILTGSPGWGTKSKTWKPRQYTVEVSNSEEMTLRVESARQRALQEVARRNRIKVSRIKETTMQFVREHVVALAS